MLGTTSTLPVVENETGFEADEAEMEARCVLRIHATTYLSTSGPPIRRGLVQCSWKNAEEEEEELEGEKNGEAESSDTAPGGSTDTPSKTW